MSQEGQQPLTRSARVKLIIIHSLFLQGQNSKTNGVMPHNYITLCLGSSTFFYILAHSKFNRMLDECKLSFSEQGFITQFKFLLKS